MRIKQKVWDSAAINADNLSELYLTLGDVAQAVAFGRQSVEFADKSGDVFENEKQRAKLAFALLQNGRLNEAQKYFKEAENIKKKNNPDFHLLSSLGGFMICELLLNQGQVEEVLKRANETIKIAIRNYWLLDIALNQLSLGRAYLSQALTSPSVPLQRGKIMEQAADYMNQAVDGLRKAGRENHLPRSLFARAELYRLQGAYPSAWDDVEEAYDIAERGEMRLWLTDYHLGASRLLISEFGMRNTGTEEKLNRDEILAQLKEHLEKVTILVNETGYHRRDPELLLHAQFHFVNGDKEKTWIWLNKAKERFDEMGIRMWDFEVRELEEKLGT